MPQMPEIATDNIRCGKLQGRRVYRYKTKIQKKLQT